MATLHPFGTSPSQLSEGYRMTETIIGESIALMSKYHDDTRLILGAEIYNQPGIYEMAVMVKENETSQEPS